MPGVNNNLYPPIIASYMPAFVRTTACRVYFSLSAFNSLKAIKNVQVVVNNQSTNQSVLKADAYPSGIKIATLNVDNSITGEDKYYVTINPSDLETGIFEINQFYKVQIRFTGISAAAPPTDTSKGLAAWLVANQNFFSEWSTVCLIKGIQRPLITLRGFDDMTGSDELSLSSEVVDFVGRMYFAENETIEKETLKSYQIRIYNNAEVLLFDSGTIYTEVYNPNEINYTSPYQLENGNKYIVKFAFETYNGYVNNDYQYTFSIISNAIDVLNAKITAEPDVEYGRIKVNILGDNETSFLGNLTIRRASSKDNFILWQDVRTEMIISDNKLNYTWYDYTVESGVWYKYCAQRRNSKNGGRGTIITIDKPVMVNLDDMFLTTENMQLRVRYDPAVTSFKTTVADSKTDTIGSKYPFFKRNGNLAYREFPISGLITWFCDDQGVFLNKDNIYQYADVKKAYDDYNNEYNIDQWQDYIYEREFREKVMDFLNADDVKLFRSATEGNILVRLMNVSFTPNQTLGRMIYSFSANAYEIDECTINNYNAYHILTVGDWVREVAHSFNQLGQVQVQFSADDELIKTLKDKYKYNTIQDYVLDVSDLIWLRIEFDSPPYLIREAANGGLEPLPADAQANEDTFYGYIIYVNDEPIAVSPRGFYELHDEDTEISSLRVIPRGDKKISMTIDYIARMIESENTSKIASKIYSSKKAGQLWGVFEPQDSVSRQIYSKYLLNYTTYYQRLVSIDKMVVEAEPGSIVYVKDSYDDDYYRHEVGATGTLEFYDDEAVITGVYFYGVHLDKAPETDRDIARDDEYIETGITVAKFAEIDKPIKNGVYTVTDETNTLAAMKSNDEYIQMLSAAAADTNQYVYYHEHWYPFTADGDVICPVIGLVNYIYEMVKGEY